MQEAPTEVVVVDQKEEAVAADTVDTKAVEDLTVAEEATIEAAPEPVVAKEEKKEEEEPKKEEEKPVDPKALARELAERELAEIRAQREEAEMKANAAVQGRQEALALAAAKVTAAHHCCVLLCPCHHTQRKNLGGLSKPSRIFWRNTS